MEKQELSRVEIRGSLTDAMIAGQGVEIVGVLLTEAVTKGANLENKFILAKSVTEKTDVVSTVQVTEEEEMQVRRFVDSLNYKERMSLITKSWGGRVFSRIISKKQSYYSRLVESITTTPRLEGQSTSC